MSPIQERIANLQQRIDAAIQQYARPAGSVQLLAVSKTRPAEEIREAYSAGQRSFGENYLQDAVEKIEQLRDIDIEWHFIGRVQSNKTKLIAEHFHWVHSVDTLKQARRLSEQRPAALPPLNICLQINIDAEDSKGGTTQQKSTELVQEIAQLPRLHLRGLMTLPAPATELEEQRRPFRMLRELRDQIATPELPLETLSMGMSADLEAAIAEGATMVRVGTAIFGPRHSR
jgi:pyridoxal phosphate enzyme (YggS family)